MGSKFKPRQEKSRNDMIKDMFLIQGAKSGPMKDRREKRASNRRTRREMEEQEDRDDWEDDG